MKYKVGDKVRIKSKEYITNNLKRFGIVEPMLNYANKDAVIVSVDANSGEGYRIDIDNKVWLWFEDLLSYNPEKSILSEEVIKDIAEVVKKHNLGVCVSENDGKLIIEPLKVEEDLKKGTHVMVTNDINNEAWTLRQYLSNGYCDAFRTDSLYLPPMKFRFIIAFEKFNPNDIEESLKYNIVK